MVLAWLYLRKSRAEADDFDVLWKHRQALLDLAERDGVPIDPANIREEVGSGDQIETRPVFRQLLAEWQALPKAKGRRLVYVADADRLSRGVLTERGQVQETIIKAGILIRTPGGYSNLEDPDQLLLHEVKGSLARHELLRYKQRVERARAEMTRAGQLQTGRPPMGYLWSKDAFQPVPDPALFPILVDACKRVHAISVYRLAQEHGVNEATLLQALRSPTIAGWPAKRWTKAGGMKKPLAREEWIWPEKPGDYPAACTLEEWHKIQQVLAQRWKLRGKTTGENKWCVDVVRFQGYEEHPACCCSLWRNSGRAHSTSVPTYALRKRHSSLYIARDVVHEQAEAAITRLAQDHRLLALIQQLEQEATSRPETPSRDQLHEQLERQRRRLARLKLEWDEGDEEDRLANEQAQGDVKREIGRLKGELERSRQPLQLDQSAHEGLETLEGLAPDMMAAASEEQKRIIARGLLKITIIIRELGAEERMGRGPRYERVPRIDYAEPIALLLA